MTSLDAGIPTFNAPPERLARAVRSVLACPGVARILVIDDGSTEPVDGRAFADADPSGRVSVVRWANAGASAARNRALRESSAEWMIFVDDDDELLTAGVSAMMDLALRTGAVAAVAARINVLPGGVEKIKPVPEEWADRVLPSPGHVFRPIALFGASGLLVRRGVIDRGVGFDEGLWLGEDRDFLRRVGELGPIAVSSALALRVTIHAGGTNLSSPAHFARRIRDHLIVLDRYRDGVSEGHFREATRWLVNAAAKARVDRVSWGMLMDACHGRGWAVPFKARVRRVFMPGRRATKD